MSEPRAPYMPTISKTTEWETPRDLFDKLWDEFGGFDLDPCCQFNDYTAQRVLQNGGSVYTPLDDGLSQPWSGKVFMNPPYGRGVEAWVAKAVEEVKVGHAELVVALLKATTDTKWFQKYVIDQMPSTDVAAAWLAGLIDGEGCIYIRLNRATERTKHVSDQYSLCLKVTMHYKERAIFERLQSIFGGYLSRAGTVNAISWYANSTAAEAILHRVRPYLQSKAKQADLAFSFQAITNTKCSRSGVPPAIQSERRRIYQALRDAKKEDVVIAQPTNVVAIPRFIKGRLKFVNAPSHAPFPSVIIVWRGDGC